MSTKAVSIALKAAKAHIASQDWEKARSESMKALSFDPQNYFGNVYLGISLHNQGDFDASESAYREAISAEGVERQRKPKDESPTAWQGLVKLYETQRKVDEYMESALKLASIYRDMDDRTKCQTVVDKILPFVREHGSKEQLKQALRILLPESPIYDFLEGRIPHPSHTYDRIIQIVEKEETEKINKEIANRRSRLGSVKGQVSLEVKREVLGPSPLEGLYQQLLSWSDDEDVRREADRKLLQHAYDKLVVLPEAQKREQREKVLKWAEGLVILKHPFELAWNIFIEWKDCDSIGDHDANVLKEYIEFFPNSGLTKVLQSYINSEISQFPLQEKKGDESRKESTVSDPVGPIQLTAPDKILDSMIGGLNESPQSVLGHRILGEYYTFLNDFESAVDIARKGKKTLAKSTSQTGLCFQRNSDALTVTLATALIHYQTPKHHGEAKAGFEDVLRRNTKYGPALVGLGLILEEQQDYAGAADLLEKALTLSPHDVKIMSEAAWCNVLQAKYEEGVSQLESCLHLIAGVDPRSRNLKAQILWRIGTAIWNSDEQGRADREGAYSYFMSALQSDQNFAPAYTSLGIFYQDISGDSARADRCFQKAFEISAGEVEAAERLARSFAENREWELVDIIARRVVDADGKRLIPGRKVSWPQSAIGVVELNAQNFNMAIQAFQAALRTSPSDYHSWVGLGEAYASSGKWVAAMKVFLQAEKLDSTSWFPKYMLANVRREIGNYEDACSGYRSVLELRPKEFGILVALSETLLAAAWSYVETGFFGRAADCAAESLKVARKIVAERPDAFNLWKTVGDGCLIFSWVLSLVERMPQELVVKTLEEDIDLQEFNILAEVDGVGPQALKNDKAGGLTTCLQLAILAYKRGIYASAGDRHAHAVAWFNLGCAEYRAYVTLSERPLKYRMAAITCFKRTIKLEPGNHEFWNALGVATGELNVKVAQHALVRALYINEKNARVWTNLATLCLMQHDIQLANEAFSRAQSADPEYALAWVGQGLIATLVGSAGEAQELFEHAFEISDSSSIIVKRQFSTAVFDRILQTKSSPTPGSFIGPIFALQKLEQGTPDDVVALRLSALFGERVGNFVSASEKLEAVCSRLEQRYDETESEEDLIQYAQAKADLARVMLGRGEYEAAVESSEFTLNLSGNIEKLVACRLSAHLTAGLANYYLGRMDESLEMFKAALNESGENPDVVCLLSQVLWAKGGDEERDVSREQLFTCIENNPDHLQSIMLLGAIGILDNNANILEAVMDDLRAVRGRDGLGKASRQNVDQLLNKIAQLQGKGDSTAVAAAAVFIQPSLPSAWSNLSDLAGRNQNALAMALKVALESKTMDPEELCHAHAQQGVISCDQKAIMVAPWRADGWNGLAEDVQAAG